jgi:hypothetical protein
MKRQRLIRVLHELKPTCVTRLPTYFASIHLTIHLPLASKCNGQSHNQGSLQGQDGYLSLRRRSSTREPENKADSSLSTSSGPEKGRHAQILNVSPSCEEDIWNPETDRFSEN